MHANQLLANSISQRNTQNKCSYKKSGNSSPTYRGRSLLASDDKENKIEKITVKDITLKAGYNRSTFYAYFTDVHDVLEQIEEDLMPGAEHLPPIDTSREPSPDFFKNIITIYEKNSGYYSVLLSENGDPRFALKLKNIFKSMMMDAMTNRVNISPEEMDYALEFLVGATLSIVKHWFDQDKNIPMQQLLPLMYKLMDNRFVQELDMDMDL